MKSNNAAMEGKTQFSNSRIMVGVAWSQGQREYMQVRKDKLSKKILATELLNICMYGTTLEK